ncbi:DUF4913 domain-containing protein [Streptomyces platensis]|uniref:DUF4913 domain-containing protein n=1 Tax=Streptomyces platensis TaxID=58346 RepID=UPI003325D0A8
MTERPTDETPAAAETAEAEGVDTQPADDTAPAPPADAAADSMAEDVADLRALVHALAEQLEETTRRLEGVMEAAAEADADENDTEEEGAGGGETSAGTGDKSGADGKESPKKSPAPPLILKLGGDEYDQELALLSNWVRYLLAPYYLTEISSQAPWCPRWWEHPQAVARLHALWTAWQELTTPEAGGWTGPSIWHRDHLDPCIAALRDPSGPFAGCMIKPEHEQHILPEQPYSDPLPLPAIESDEE